MDSTFKELLSEHNVPSTASWQHAVKLISSDGRYELFRHHPERKQMFNNYKIQRSKEEKEEQRLKIKRARERLEELLQNHEKINSSTRYRQAQEVLGGLDVWKTVPEQERREIFRDVIEHLGMKEREAAKTVRKRNMKRLAEILDGMTSVSYRTRWEEAQQLLLDNPVFSTDTDLLGMDKEDALIVFEDHIRALEKIDEDERRREKIRLYRNQRKNRQAFLSLLDELHEQGKLTSISKWCNMYHDISSDPRFAAMLTQPLSGSTPLDLFKFYLQDLRDRYEDEKIIIREILANKKFEVKLDTTYESFADVVSTDDRSEKLDAGNVKLIYERLLEKVKEKERERIHEENKKRKKLESNFMSLLHSLEPAIDEKAIWDHVRKAIVDDEAFLAIPSEEERISLFQSYIETIQSTCTHHHSKKGKKKSEKKRGKESRKRRVSRSSSLSSQSSVEDEEEKRRGRRDRSNTRSPSRGSRNGRVREERVREESKSRRRDVSRCGSRSRSRSHSSLSCGSDRETSPLRDGRKKLNRSSRGGSRQKSDQKSDHRSSESNGKQVEGSDIPSQRLAAKESDSEASDIEELERQRRLLLQQLAAHAN